MQDFKFNCPHCTQTLAVSHDLSGESVNCPSCRKIIKIPYAKNIETKSEPGRSEISSATRVKFWAKILAAPLSLLAVLSFALYLSSDYRAFNKAIEFHEQKQYVQCLETLAHVSADNKCSSRFVELAGDCNLRCAEEALAVRRYDECLQCLEQIPKNFQRYTDVLELISKCKAENVKRLLALNIKKACTLFNTRRFAEAQTLLDSLQASDDAQLAGTVKRLRESLKFRFQVEQLPLDPIVMKEAVVISDLHNVKVNKGLVNWIDLTDVKRENLEPCKQIHLLNPTQDKVKPDVNIFILNKDGVIIFEYSDSWSVDALDFNQSQTIDVISQFAFPGSLAFSKWAVIGWDISPAYALCVGSKTTYDHIKEHITSELKNISQAPPIITQYSYNLKDFLPEAVQFSFNNEIPINNSTIVDSLTFTESQVLISYWNRSEMRIKPNIAGYIFNNDGVIIASFSDKWDWLSLSPGERQKETTSISFSIPDELVFSRWAHTSYDVKPAWVLLAGSSKQFHDLKQRTEDRINKLNNISSPQE